MTIGDDMTLCFRDMPSWVMVAVASRIARQVQGAAACLSESDRDAVNDAIQAAEKSAQDGHIDERALELAEFSEEGVGTCSQCESAQSRSRGFGRIRNCGSGTFGDEQTRTHSCGGASVGRGATGDQARVPVRFRGGH